MKKKVLCKEYLFISFCLLSLFFSIFALFCVKSVDDKGDTVPCCCIFIPITFFALCCIAFIILCFACFYSNENDFAKNIFLEQENIDEYPSIFRNRREVTCGIGLYFLENAYFTESQINSIVFLGETTVIGNSAFQSCKYLYNIHLPKHLFSIKKSTFEDCEQLKYLSIPNTLKYIEESAFKDCKSLKNLTIPESVESIGQDAFAGCENLVLEFQSTDAKKVNDLLEKSGISNDQKITFDGRKRTVADFKKENAEQIANKNGS